MSSDLNKVALEICGLQGYTFDRVVGGGSYKETFHVKMPDGVSQALKVFRQSNSTNRTNREVAAMERCDHPNIGRIFEVDTVEVAEEEYLYSLEEFLPGGTLGDRISGGTLSPSEVLSLGSSLISAVSHIASHRLVHRDLKPENIMFREDKKTPVIVDFGLVRDLNSSSITKTYLSSGPGTPYYSAPEQLNNDKNLIDWRTDQFALGVLLTESLFGRHHPYSPGSADDIDTLEFVAERQGPSDRFKDAANEVGLPILIPMVAPYPIDRIRIPGTLEAEWQAQRKSL